MSRYAVASDWHLNSGDVLVRTTDTRLIGEFLKWCETEVDRLYLAGDIFDVRLTTLERIRKVNYPVADKAIELIESGKAVYCPGNHDWPLMGMNGTVEYAPVDGTGLVVIHGHQFDPTCKVFTFRFDEYREWLVKLVKDKTGIPLWPNLEKRKHSKTLSLPKNLLMGLFTRRAQRFAKQHGYRGVVYGHMHLAGKYSDDPLVFNSGCCIEGNSDYLLIEDGEVE